MNSKGVVSSLIGKGLRPGQAFPGLVDKFPLNRAKKGECFFTGEKLSQQEMYPPGLTPRHMKQELYEAVIHRKDASHCLLCQVQLDGQKLYMQRMQPREMEHHHCDRCWDYHLLIAGLIHGVPEVEQYVNGCPTAIPHQPVPRGVSGPPQMALPYESLDEYRVPYTNVVEYEPVLVNGRGYVWQQKAN
jgi:hypothetical protein